MDEQALDGSSRTRTYQAFGLSVQNWEYNAKSVTLAASKQPSIRLILSGRCREYGGSYNAEVHAPFTVIFYPANVNRTRQHFHLVDSQHLVMEFDRSLLATKSMSKLVHPFAIYSPEALELISLLLMNLGTLYASQSKILSLSQQVLAMIAAEYSKSKTNPPQVLQLLKTIHKRFRERGLVHEQLIKELGYGVSHTSAMFSKYMGCPIGTYIRRLRLEYSRFLILNSTFNMGAIAGYAGFCNPSRLTSAFKREVGVAPTTYQQSIRGLTVPNTRLLMNVNRYQTRKAS